MEHWLRARFQPPCWFLGEDGKPVTLSEKHIGISRYMAGEGQVLLKNDGLLPFKKGTKIAVFGKAQADFVKGGSGSGEVWTARDYGLVDGLKEKEAEGKLEYFHELTDFYVDDVKKQFDKSVADGYTMTAMLGSSEAQFRAGDITGKATEAPVPAELVARAKAYTDTAIITICRRSGEFADRSAVKGDYYLSDEEVALIETVKANFAHIAVLLNVGGMMDSSWYADDPALQSVLLMWNPGMVGGFATADILCGDVNPSGHLTDTLAKRYEDYPSSESFKESTDYVNYTEDIFVGYRYFETIPGAKEKVNYPFGFGLSYTTFEMNCRSAVCENGEIAVTVDVKNVGNCAGKQVVQVYFSAPQGKLGKAARELAGFAKTKLLAAGEQETVTVRFAVKDMASYDDMGVHQKSAYVLEQGEYAVYFGENVRDLTDTGYRYKVAEAFVVTEQLTERCAPEALPRRMKADGTYEELPFRAHKLPQYPVREATTAEKPAMFHKFKTVVEGRISLDSFIAQIPNDDIAVLLGGTPNTTITQTSGFGGMEEKYGIPAFMTADSPAGVRVKRQTCARMTSFPCATLQACSWDTEIPLMMATAVGKEMKENNFYAWLAPALNIHRNPLCGRNFEYYSEDPLISGKMAAAAVRGIQSQYVSAGIKHFACNNKEENRKEYDSRVSERALREIYLRGFEICVKEADPKGLMTCYNRINGHYGSESSDLLLYILREEWGFDGFVMTDWNNHGLQSREVRAGNDIRMPRGDARPIQVCVREKWISRGELEFCLRNMLKTFLWYDNGAGDRQDP